MMFSSASYAKKTSGTMSSMIWFRHENAFEPARRWNPLFTLFYETCQWGNGQVGSFMNAFTVREQALSKYSWAVPNEGAIDLIARYSPLVEIGAGTGYWARLLEDAGADIVAYDLKPNENPWTCIYQGNALVSQLHPYRTLFLCWPPLEDNMALHALVAHHLAGGMRVVFVGEGEGGCTANDAFFEFLEKHYVRELTYTIPQWPGVNDRLSVHRRIS